MPQAEKSYSFPGCRLIHFEPWRKGSRSKDSRGDGPRNEGPGDKDTRSALIKGQFPSIAEQNMSEPKVDNNNNNNNNNNKMKMRIAV
ncbi:hypothetical protein BGZ65_009660, partial [Modicella reniformis]